MSDYKSAFNAIAADISAIIALLGFDKYPGVDQVLRAITDLMLAKAEAQQVKGERDAAQSRVAELEAEVKDADGLSKILGDLLREIDLTIRGPEPELTRSGYPDLPQRVKTLVEERNAAKARVAELEKKEPASCTPAGYRIEARDERGIVRRDCLSRVPFGPDLLNAKEWAGEFHVTSTPLYAAPVAQAGQVPQAWLDVQAERRRQIEAEDWSPEHDDEHVCDEIAAFACFYLMPPAARDWDASSTGYGETLGEAIVPEGWEPKTGDRRRDLVKAGALVLAEIERLDRAAAPEQGGRDE